MGLSPDDEIVVRDSVARAIEGNADLVTLIKIHEEGLRRARRNARTATANLAGEERTIAMRQLALDLLTAGLKGRMS
jgi:hypothetical protein